MGLVRNAALVLGERRVAEAEPALTRRLTDAGEDPAVRAAAAWALGRMGTASRVESPAPYREAAMRHVCDAVLRTGNAQADRRIERLRQSLAGEASCREPWPAARIHGTADPLHRSPRRDSSRQVSRLRSKSTSRSRLVVANCEWRGDDTCGGLVV